MRTTSVLLVMKINAYSNISYYRDMQLSGTVMETL